MIWGDVSHYFRSAIHIETKSASNVVTLRCGCPFQLLCFRFLRQLQHVDRAPRFADPNVGPRLGKSLYKPYIRWIFKGYNPQESLQNTIKYHGYTVRVTPNCPLNHDLGFLKPWLRWKPIFLVVLDDFPMKDIGSVEVSCKCVCVYVHT